MKLFKKAKSKFYWYDFTVRGQRYRGSTNETKAARAAKVAGLKLAHVVENTDPLPQKAPVLLEFSRRFLEWLDKVRLEDKTKTYYRDGWRLIKTTTIVGMRLDQITKDVIEGLRPPMMVSGNERERSGRNYERPAPALAATADLKELEETA